MKKIKPIAIINGVCGSNPNWLGQYKNALYRNGDHSKLNGPWGIHVLPDGRLLISSKPVSMQILTNKGEIEKTITGFPAVQFQGHGGLLDITIDPEFTKNRMVF